MKLTFEDFHVLQVLQLQHIM